MQGSEELLAATQDATVVVRRHLELALSAKAEAALVSASTCSTIKKLDMEGAKGDVQLKSSEEETGLGQGEGEGVKNVSYQMDNEDMLDGAYQNHRTGKEEKDTEEHFEPFY